MQGLNQYNIVKLAAGETTTLPDGFAYGYIENDTLVGAECSWRLNYPGKYNASDKNSFFESTIGFVFPSTTPMGHKGPQITCLTGNILIVFQS